MQRELTGYGQTNKCYAEQLFVGIVGKGCMTTPRFRQTRPAGQE
jgi:hypothetical protein